MAQPDRLVAADVVAALPRLRRYARVLIGDTERADQLVVATLASAWRRQRAWPAAMSLPMWLFCLMHAAHRRDPRRRGFAAARAPVAIHAGAGERSKERAGSRDLGAATAEIRERVLQLPVEEREVLVLAAVERLSYEEIATLLDVPVATVMSTLTRARDRMGAMISFEADSSGVP